MSRHWTKEALLEQIRGGLIVSCQAAQGDAFFGPDYVSRFAMSAVRGGACGIRANTVPDVAAIMAAVEVPVIGLIKRDYEGCSCYITPTMREVEELAAVEVPVIAVDATDRPHPDGQDGAAFLRAIRARFPERLLMADISTFAEGMAAAEAGADLVSTTLSGYTEESPKSDLPDLSCCGGWRLSLRCRSSRRGGSGHRSSSVRRWIWARLPLWWAAPSHVRTKSPVIFYRG